MSAHLPFYQTLRQRIAAAVAAHVPAASRDRLALLTFGILAATSAVIAQAAAELHALRLTQASSPDSIARRLRRTLNDPALTAATCYEPVLPRVIDWPALLRGSRRVVLIVDESSKADEVHLFRVSLAYWGGSLPLGWAVWEQNHNGRSQ